MVQFEAADDIEEFHGVFERRQTTIMKIRRRILDASQHKSFDRSIRRGSKPFKMQVMHLVIGERRRLMTGRTFRFSEKEVFPLRFERARLPTVQTTRHGIEFRRRREIDHVLHLRHVGYRHPVDDVHAFFHGPYGISVEIGRALLEFGEIFHRSDGAL